jgi:hypothetical protein
VKFLVALIIIVGVVVVFNAVYGLSTFKSVPTTGSATGTSADSSGFGPGTAGFPGNLPTSTVQQGSTGAATVTARPHPVS